MNSNILALIRKTENLKLLFSLTLQHDLQLKELLRIIFSRFFTLTVNKMEGAFVKYSIKQML